MTESEKAALVEFINAVITSLNGSEPEEPNKFAGDLSEYTKKVFDVALASLAAEPVYQERRYQFIGKKQLEYWADIDKSTYGYLPESERRLIYTTPPAPTIGNSPVIPDGWIKCSERMPPEYLEVNVSDGLQSFTAYYTGEEPELWCQISELAEEPGVIRFWQPFPAAPEPEGL